MPPFHCSRLTSLFPALPFLFLPINLIFVRWKCFFVLFYCYRQHYGRRTSQIFYCWSFTGKSKDIVRFCKFAYMKRKHYGPVTSVSLSVSIIILFLRTPFVAYFPEPILLKCYILPQKCIMHFSPWARCHVLSTLASEQSDYFASKGKS